MKTVHLFFDVAAAPRFAPPPALCGEPKPERAVNAKAWHAGMYQPNPDEDEWICGPCMAAVGEVIAREGKLP